MDKKNYLRLVEDYPNVVEACLHGGVTFDQSNKLLVETEDAAAFATAPCDTIELSIYRSAPFPLRARRFACRTTRLRLKLAFETRKQLILDEGNRLINGGRLVSDLGEQASEPFIDFL